MKIKLSCGIVEIDAIDYIKFLDDGYHQVFDGNWTQIELDLSGGRFVNLKGDEARDFVKILNAPTTSEIIEAHSRHMSALDATLVERGYSEDVPVEKLFPEDLDDIFNDDEEDEEVDEAHLVVSDFAYDSKRETT